MLKHRFGLFLLVSVFLLFVAGCGSSKSDVIDQLVSKEENVLHMHMFSSSREWDDEVNKVLNSESALVEHIPHVTVHTEEKKLKWLEVLGLEAKRPVIVIFDHEQMVYHTSEPEQLREYAKTLD
ncbi:hypothetical protein MKX42_24700 [Paenibacillus sp. FSL R7-0204]|uniref:hypothetical protein n=1 Tax=Paenibacillus sp. FSL R7-0204 TaxID=2921675 RepID=UPI0030F5A88B